MSATGGSVSGLRHVAQRIEDLHLGDLVAPEKGDDLCRHLGGSALLSPFEARDVALVGADRRGNRGLRDAARNAQPTEWGFDHRDAQSMRHTYSRQVAIDASSALRCNMRPANIPVVDYKEWLRALGRNVQRRRKAMKMTQAELGDACGSDQGGISRLENGEQGFLADTFFALAAKLECQPWQLLHPEFHPLFLPEAMTPAAALELHELRQLRRQVEAISDAGVKQTPKPAGKRAVDGVPPARAPDRQQRGVAPAYRPPPRKARA